MKFYEVVTFVEKRFFRMRIFIFNPEHDIALASNLEHFTAPHAGRELRHDLGFLPALWADADDYVLVDDVEAAREAMRKLSITMKAHVVDKDMIFSVLDKSIGNATVNPWGWDLAMRNYMKRVGVSLSCLPSNAKLNIIREVSNRAWASEHLLAPLRGIDRTVGLSERLTDVDSVERFLNLHHRIVLKAPWSSSGRGIRYVADSEQDGLQANYGLTLQLKGWVNNVIQRQGAVMAEPYYNKVLDFGMEFTSDGNGRVSYEGLSIFHTVNGAYTGNIIDDEAHKSAWLCRYIPQSLLVKVRGRVESLLSEKLNGVYAGPFGIDMMVVRVGNSLALHPCVELNLRMTMGFVALLLNRLHHIEQQTMRIGYTDGRYSLNIQNLKSSSQSTIL